jgi:hypothetical protein
MTGLYWNTVNGLLREVLERTMQSPVFHQFRLVGGTSLSLQIGHRLSVDIDLFTESEYGSIQFNKLDDFFRMHYDYVETNGGPVGMGKSYFVGTDEQNAIKVDLYYTDHFIQPEIEVDGIRLATIEEVLAMKLDVIDRGGRKKDFWDIHAMINKYSLEDMLVLHQARYPYSHHPENIIANMVSFSEADDDFDPVCCRGELWELIKYDLVRWVDRFKS